MISIVIPCYNEEKRIKKTLDKVVSYMKGKYEIILVDDGSTDNTVKVAKKYNIKILKNEKNMGKGFSVRKGFLNARGDFVLFTDADLSTPIEELDKFMKLSRNYDIVFGSRKEYGAKITEKQTWLRILAGNIFPLIVRMLILPSVKDSQCGFKLFSKNCKSIFKKQTITGFAFDVELLYLAKKYNLKAKEIGVNWNNDKNSKVRLFRDSIRMLIEIFKIKLNSLLGKYD